MTWKEYQRKPAIVRAVQWWPHMAVEGVTYRQICIEDADGERLIPTGARLITEQGEFLLSPGDWIVEASGQRWIVEGKCFDALYESTEGVFPHGRLEQRPSCIRQGESTVAYLLGLKQPIKPGGEGA